MPGRVLFRGPAHILTALDDDVRERIGDDVIGLPVTEAICDPRARPLAAALDRVFATGEPETIELENLAGETREIRIEPFTRRGRVMGVVSEWRRIAVRPIPVVLATVIALQA